MEKKDYTNLPLDEYISDHNLMDPSLKEQNRKAVDTSEMPALIPAPAFIQKGISPLKRMAYRRPLRRKSIFERLGWREHFGKRNKRWYTHRRWVANSRKIKAKQRRFAQIPGDLRMRIALARLNKTRKMYEEQTRDLMPILQLIRQVPAPLLSSLASQRKKPKLFRSSSNASLNSVTSPKSSVNGSSFKIPPPVFGASKNLAPVTTSVAHSIPPFDPPLNCRSSSRPGSIMSMGSSVTTDVRGMRSVNAESSTTPVNYDDMPRLANIRSPDNREDIPRLKFFRPPGYEPLTRSPPSAECFRNGNEEMPALSRVPVRNSQIYGLDQTMSNRGNGTRSGIGVHCAGIRVSDAFAYLNQNAYE